MKAYLALISAAVIGLAACSQEPAAPAAEATPAAEAPASEAPAAEAAPADAAEAPAVCIRAATVESNDNMQFNTKDIQVSKACKELYHHSGNIPVRNLKPAWSYKQPCDCQS